MTVAELYEAWEKYPIATPPHVAVLMGLKRRIYGIKRVSIDRYELVLKHIDTPIPVTGSRNVYPMLVDKHDRT